MTTTPQEEISVRKLTFALIALALTVDAYAADLKIGVVDPIATISGTSDYKKAAADLDKDTAADKSKLMKLQGELKVCQQKLGAEASTLSATEQASLKTNCEAKYRDFQTLGQSYNKVAQEREQAILKDIGPKFQKAVEAVAKEAGYDLVVQREAVLFMKPDFDISAKVTEKINATK